MFFHPTLGPVSASGSQLFTSTFLRRCARLFWSFLVASTTLLVLLMVNSKVLFQRLQTGIREISKAFSRVAYIHTYFYGHLIAPEDGVCNLYAQPLNFRPKPWLNMAFKITMYQRHPALFLILHIRKHELLSWCNTAFWSRNLFRFFPSEQCHYFVVKS